MQKLLETGHHWISWHGNNERENATELNIEMIQLFLSQCSACF